MNFDFISCTAIYCCVLQLEMLLRIYVYMCICTATYFDIIFCTWTTYGYVLRLEMQVRLV